MPICTSMLSPSTHVPSFLRCFRGTGRRVTGQDVARDLREAQGSSPLGRGRASKWETELEAHF